MSVLLIIGAIADALLAVLMIALSGFIFGGPPEGMAGAPSDEAAWVGELIACVAAPILGFVLRRHGKPSVGLLIVWLPPAAALVLSSGVIHPY